MTSRDGGRPGAGLVEASALGHVARDQIPMMSPAAFRTGDTVNDGDLTAARGKWEDRR
jgi:hypothetical protein